MTRESAFRPLAPPQNLKDAVVARVTEVINGGQLKPGDRLPTEQGMIAAFGVSRTVVREAIAALRAEGLVETRQGAGAFVAGDMRKRPFRIQADELQSIDNVVRIMELRMGVEIEAAGFAAERRTKKDLEHLQQTLVLFAESVERGEDAVAADYQFHRSIARSSGNDYLVSFLDFLGWHIIPRRNVQVEVLRSRAELKYLRRVLTEHESILTAIRSQNPRSARAAMRRHLAKGRERYLRFAERTRVERG